MALGLYFPNSRVTLRATDSGVVAHVDRYDVAGLEYTAPLPPETVEALVAICERVELGRWR